MSPLYISNLLTPYKQEKQLRSNSKILFKEPRFAKSWGSRSFLCAAPRLWNKLPEYVKTAKSVDSFNPCSPEGFPKHIFLRGVVATPLWIINTEGHITLNLLPVYRFGHPLSIDTKISTNH